MSEFVRSALDSLLDILAPSVAKVFGLVLAYLFVGPAVLYHLAAIAIVLDTITGLVKAARNSNISSHTFRVKTMAKLVSYMAAVAGAGLLHHALKEMGIDGTTTLLAVKFTMVSIVVTEVLSMWENVRETTGNKIVAQKAFDRILESFKDDKEG